IHFDDLWIDRLLELQADPEVNLVIPQVYSSRWNPQKRTAAFSVTYLLTNRKSEAFPLGPPGPQGFWRPVPNANHQRWAASMARANRPRGYTQDVVRPSDDAIINLCDLAPARVPGGGGPNPQNNGNPGNRQMHTTCPDPFDSWLWYECLIEETDDNGVV